MGKRIGTKQRKTRHKLQLSCREKGKISLSKYFQDFVEGDRVNLKLNANVQKGRFYSRFHGLGGIVVGKRGSCYIVRIKDGHKVKDLNVHPIHMSKQK